MQTKDSAREELYTRYYDRIFGYVLGRVTNRADAEDLTSEVFLRLLSREDGFDPERSGAPTYIFRTMQSVLTDFFRRDRGVYVPLDDVAEELGDTDDLDMLSDALSSALETLSERESAIVILHYYHGLSHREIAERMRLSYVNVRQLCHVALGKLRREMERA